VITSGVRFLVRGVVWQVAALRMRMGQLQGALEAAQAAAHAASAAAAAPATVGETVTTSADP